ncbi:MFS transporter, ENTS family, enterobactin (siderophore) exporter [Amycolatopsis sacchari]|uniref:MFS transporter, ENTS family, enterobactin (Siderophore) exporter n=1 Tax=Amycolatopsis sacchari TaxID=115433 RepID=A0A1I3P3U2_9PSEU|nr:MFS transporter, ENTS family, enterobactin (siderophore) exporter [Amycolatopsis sacchari]
MLVRLGELVIDVTPLRTSSGYRRVFTAQTLTVLTTALTNVAINLHVYQLTGSSVQVGLVSLVFGLALLAGLLAGGVLADRLDRRRLILGTRTLVAVVLAGLAVNAALPHPLLGFVYVAAVLAGAINGLGGSALMAAVPALVAPAQLAAAGALFTVTSQFGAMVGPTVAGFLAAGPGVAACFAIDAIGYLAGVALMWRIPPLPSEREPQHPLRALAEGFRFVRKDRTVAGLLLIDAWAMVFAMPYSLFPQLGEEVFGGGPSTVGLLYTAPAVGAFAGALASGWTGRFRHSGRALIASVLCWGLAITALGLSGHLWLALVCLGIAGAADTTSEILRRALLQHYTPDHLQGRVSSLWLAQATSGSAVGNAEAGLAARLLGAPGAVIGGGLVCVVGVCLVALTLPALRRASLRGERCPSLPSTA